jgi:hypothetical protein
MLGVAVGSWAPLVPCARMRLELTEHITQQWQAGLKLPDEARAVVAVVAKGALLCQLPATCRGMGTQALELLLNGLCLGGAAQDPMRVGGGRSFG